MRVGAAGRWLERLEMPPVLVRFWIGIITLTTLSFAYTMVATHVLHLKYPYGPPQFFSDDRWFDFMIYKQRFHHFRTPSFWDEWEYPFTYPAPLALVYAALYRIPHVLRGWLPTMLSFYVLAAWLLGKALARRGVPLAVAMTFSMTTLLLNYPVRTLFESANTEGLVAVIAGSGVFAVLRKRYWLGAALIAVAGTMKIFPFVLLALLLSKKRYREFAWGLVVAAVVTVSSLVIVGPTIGEAQRHIDEGIRYVKYQFIFSTNPAAVTFNHSLFTLVKFATVAVARHLHPMVILTAADLMARRLQERPLLETTFDVYVTVAALFGIVLYFVWMRRMPLLNQVLGLTLCALLLPPLSADYTLLHLLLPFGLLCLYAADTWRRGEEVRGLGACLLCFPFIFSFETYLVWRYRFSCEARTVGMMVLLGLVMRYRFAWLWLEDKDNGKRLTTNEGGSVRG